MQGVFTFAGACQVWIGKLFELIQYFLIRRI